VEGPRGAACEATRRVAAAAAAGLEPDDNAASPDVVGPINLSRGQVAADAAPQSDGPRPIK
jgi:hypothetical protein